MIVALAELQVLRFLRSFAGAGLLVGFAALGALPLAFVAELAVTSRAWRAGAGGVLQAEKAAAVVALVEMLLLAGLAYVLTMTSWQDDARKGRLRLLAQLPTPAWHGDVGFGLGVVAQLVLVHAAFLCTLATIISFTSRTGGELLLIATWPILVAACFVPWGLAEARVAESTRRTMALRGAQALQLGAGAVAFLACLDGATPAARVASATVAFARGPSLPFVRAFADMTGSWPSLLLATWATQAIGAAIVLRLFVRDSAS